MKRTTRYSLIVFGIFVFLVMAPLLILYVSGTTFNFDGTGASATGIFDAKSNPSNAQVLIDGEEHSNTPAIARFLNQGEYVFTLKKDGYYDWTKRLPIESSQVTYAQVGVEEISLIKKSTPTTLIAEGVSSFVLVGNEIWFARGNSIIHAPASNPANQVAIPLGFTPRSVHLLRDKNHLFLSGETNNAIVEINKETAWQIDFSFNPNEAVVINQNLLVNIGTIFRTYNLPTAKETILRNDVLGFTMIDNTAYFVDATGTISTEVWNGSDFQDTQIVTIDQPISLGKAQLIITDRKELFIIDHTKSLYRVNQKLELIAGQVETATLDFITNELAIRTSSELLFYNFLTNKTQLLTRSSLPVTNFLIRSNIGYGFVASQTGLEAIEIDSRDKQNRYQLLSDSPVWQISLTDNQKTIIALQDGSLVAIDIRN